MREAPSTERPRSVTILGATGSIGRQTLNLVAEDPAQYRIEALTAFKRVDELASLALEHRPKIAVIGDDALLPDLRERLAGSGIAAAAGRNAIIEAAARPAEWVMAGIVGAAGLEPTMAAVQRGAMVAFANKECLVCAGDLLLAAVAESRAILLPVDSEHNAIFQATRGARAADIESVVLTASGGPFRLQTLDDMARVTPQQAMAHPVWSMGPKISIDSATLMNKGLEIIEAHYLFGMQESAIEVLVHPQSIIHSLVRFRDGSMLAQLGEPDMRIPIAYALGWPRRIRTSAHRLDLVEVGRLEFEAPDLTRFPSLSICRRALRIKDGAPTILNAANEVAVAAFLDGRIGFLEICLTVENTMDAISNRTLDSLDDVLAMNEEARCRADEEVQRLERRV